LNSTPLCGSYKTNKSWLPPFQQRASNARSTAALRVRRTQGSEPVAPEEA
jgi:hypothetical protein